MFNKTNRKKTSCIHLIKCTQSNLITVSNGEKIGKEQEQSVKIYIESDGRGG